MLQQGLQGWTGPLQLELLQGRFTEFGPLKEGAGLLEAVLEGDEGGAEKGAELLQPTRIVVVPALGAPLEIEFRQELLGAAFMQDLAVQPIEFVPVEAGSGLVDPIETEDLGGVVEVEALLHALRRGPAQQGHVVGQGFCGVALVAEIIDRGDSIPLGELFAFLVEDQGGVGEFRGRCTKGGVEQQLLGGIGDVIFAADHVADGHGGVIHDHHEVVEGVADLIGRGPAGNDHVAAQVAAGPAHRTTDQVVPGDDGIVINAEANGGFTSFGDEGLLLFGGQVAVTVVVAGGAIGGRLLLTHGGELGFGGVAAVGLAGLQQLLNGGAMGLDSLALDHGFRVPVDPQPLQAFEDVRGVFGFAALLVGVLDAQQKFATEVPSEKPVEDRGPRRADVEGSSRAGGETHTDRRSSSSHWR